jgi:hypothetical protein
MVPNSVRMVVLLLLALLCGCGPAPEKPYPVRGKVTFQGKPVASGMVRFSNTQAGIDVVIDVHDGVYAVAVTQTPGLPEGTYQVAILPPRWARPLTPPGQAIAKPAQPPVYLDIPTKYHQPSTSGLTLTVKPGDNTFDVDMQP